ncbi:RAD50-interacting protein 1 [Chionoecetes opilio]|uniref:RAD50-interacting protein 1 n=1 Tax=Chionoecetes opilio TaxID=41210 RepID=A0A8J5CQL2_CHIOP|nr:RAD50-interacting protein 1 [Chionoecetes opilio]
MREASMLVIRWRRGKSFVVQHAYTPEELASPIFSKWARFSKTPGALGACWGIGPGVRRWGSCKSEGSRPWLPLPPPPPGSQDISSSLHIGVEGQALVGHGRLVECARALSGTQCHHLYSFLRATLLHWNKTLVHRFTCEFEGVLKSMKWPLVGEAGEGLPPASPDSIQRLCTLTQYLLQLALPEHLVPEEEGETRPPSPPGVTPGILTHFDPLLLPIQLLVNPLQVRFLYHFTGGRATNARTHPEWYYIQLLKWVTAHESFLTHRIQPVLDRCGSGGVSAKVALKCASRRGHRETRPGGSPVEFMRGLVRLAAIKVTSDLPHLLEDEDLFCATLQETLHFEREICAAHGYPRTQPSILCVLAHARVFPRWLALERKFALEVMDELVSSDGAWEVEESGGGGRETARCGDKVILLLQGITDRYKRLPQPGHRLQFLELQLELLDDFRVRLVQVMKGERQDPLTSHYPAILNTTHYLSQTLADWSDLPFFIEMQYYRETFRRAQDGTTTATPSPSSPHHTPSPSSSSSPPSSPVTPEHAKKQVTPAPAPKGVTGSVFLDAKTARCPNPHRGWMVHTRAPFYVCPRGWGAPKPFVQTAGAPAGISQALPPPTPAGAS